MRPIQRTSGRSNEGRARMAGKGTQFERTLDVAERDARAAELRQAGMSFRRIGAELGLSPSGAHAAVGRALAEVTRGPASELRELEDQRLDQLWRTALGVMVGTHVVVQHGKVVRDADGKPLPDPMPRLAAVDRLLRISERRSKLHGLDAPVEQKVTVTDVLDSRIEQLAREHDLLARLAVDVEAVAADGVGGSSG